MTYNGFTNKETWLVNLWANESFADYMDYSQSEGYDTKATAETYKDYVLDMLETSGATVEDAFAQDLISHALADVNWQELADLFNA
jgi:hypothetical protein